MSMESATAALADSPEQRPMKSLFGQPASSRESLPTDADIVDGSGTVPLREKTERFARDINAKIDALEEQIGRSANLAEHQQEEMRRALEELRNHLAQQRHEIDAQRDAITDQRDALAASRDEMQAQGHALTQHRDQLQQQHDVLDNQREALDAQQAHLESHRKALDQLSQNISAHTGALSTHTSALSTHNERLEQHEALLSNHAAQIDGLDQRQFDQQQALLGLSQEHDATTAKVDALADQLYDQHVQLSTHRNETRSHVRTLAGALLGTTVLTLGLIGYFAFNPVATTTAVENNLAALNSDMAQQRSATTNLSGELQRVGTGLTALETSVSELRGTQGELQAGQQASREDISRISNQINSYERTLNDLRNRVQRAQSTTATRGATPAASVKVRDSAWLASRPGNHYVIQLVSAGDYSGVVRFANKNARALAKYPLSSVISRRQGETWHNLMVGDFATQQQAKNALASLPADLRASKPWIRQIRSVR